MFSKININKDTVQNAFCLFSRNVQNGSYFTLPYQGRMPLIQCTLPFESLLSCFFLSKAPTPNCYNHCIISLSTSPIANYNKSYQ